MDGMVIIPLDEYRRLIEREEDLIATRAKMAMAARRLDEYLENYSDTELEAILKGLRLW